MVAANESFLERVRPRYWVYIVGACLVLAHGMFAYGQVFPMWELNYHVDVNMTFTAKSWEAKLLWWELDLPESYVVAMKDAKTLDVFTYGNAISQLWDAKNLGGSFGPQLTAILLVFFSGVWPHAKLFLLNLYWHKSVHENTRTTAFYWLSTFGKWSLADVIVVCVMIGVLNLDFEVQPRAILKGIATELPEAIALVKNATTKAEAEHKICETLLHWPSGLCNVSVDLLYRNPDLVSKFGRNLLTGVGTSGGGIATLRVAGLHGIYVFCFAVVLSLLLGFGIDLLDHESRARNAEVRRGCPPANTVGVTGSPGRTYLSVENEEEISHRPGCTRMVSVQGPDVPVLLLRRISKRVWTARKYVVLAISCMIGLVLVVLGVFADSIERTVPGNLPLLVEKITEIDWSQGYSLWTLAEVTGASGGPDFLLQGTFMVFIVFGPIIRAFVCLLNLVLPLTKKLHRTFMTVIDLLGCFCAWEVFAVAMVLVQMEMPDITNTIIGNENPVCRALSKGTGLGQSCFRVEFNVLPTFLIVLIGGSILMLVATLSVKLGFKGLDPYQDGDRGGPYCCSSCPYVLFDFDGDLRCTSESHEATPLLTQMERQRI